ncbi:MAG: hypothetical protein LBM07_05750 [Culturomica sp.]|jgi:hypothetical protein|nr:hypothetical protein [Culturomica sp.]
MKYLLIITALFAVNLCSAQDVQDLRNDTIASMTDSSAVVSPDSASIASQPIYKHTDIYFRLLQDSSAGRVELTEDSYVRELMMLHLQLSDETKTINGYRIQIFSGSSYDYTLEDVTAVKDEFSQYFPNVPVYLDYFDPDFKIRVGNFKTRLESIPMLKRIRRHYPSCYPVKTDIPVGDIRQLQEPAVDVQPNDVQPTAAVDTLSNIERLKALTKKFEYK